MDIFITGIGTDVGKTIASAVFVEALQADYFKPIQAGDLHYSDTDKVKELVDHKESSFYPNAYALKTPMSPHAAADIDNVKINIDHIKRPVTNAHLVIEGAGGLFVPINHQECILDLIKPMDKVILVSRHYLGSINHTLLSHQMLSHRNIDHGILFIGDEHPTTEAIIEKMTGIKAIGRIPHLKEVTPKTIRSVADRLKINILNELQLKN